MYEAIRFLLISFVLGYQSIDGLGNNQNNPRLGAYQTTYLRFITPEYVDGVGQLVTSRANPRHVSNSLLSRYPKLQNFHSLSDTTAYWGQFIAHDILLTQKNSSEPLVFEYPRCDTQFDSTCVNRTITISRALCESPIQGHRKQLNFQTSFVDASMVYGATIERSNALRVGRDGLLTTSAGNLLPWRNVSDNNPWTGMAGTGKLFLTGDVRGNENPALQSFHTLFMREHNRKAREVKQLFPNFYGDEEIFQIARRWVISIIQKITFDEYLPAILGEPLPTYTGYRPEVDPSIEVMFSTASFRYGHSAISSSIQRVNERGNIIRQGNLLLRDVFFNTDPVEERGIEDILRGLVSQIDQEVDAAFVDDLRNHGPDPPFDLAALNILRGRDFGLPNYNAVRQYFNLTRLNSFSDFNDTLAAAVLPTLYASVNDIDLFVGGLLEPHIKGELGAVFHASIKDQFLRLRNGDRYYYENPGVLSPTDLAIIKQDSLSKVILRNTNITFFPSSAFTHYTGDFIDGKSKSSSGTAPQTNSLDFVPGVFSMKWVVSGSSAVVTLCHKEPGWFAVGFGSTTMSGSDMIMITRQSGVLIVRELLGTGNVDPSVKPAQSLQINDVSTAEGCTNAVSFTLPSYIPISTSKMIYAYSSSSYTFAYHGPANRGALGLNFLASTGSATQISSGPSFMFKVFHGGSMFMVYVFLYPAGVFLARYYHGLSNWVDYHQLMMSIGMTQSLFTVISIVMANNGTVFRPTVHRILGILVASINLLTFSLGNTIKLRNSGFYIRYRRKIHIILGYVTVFGGLVNCFFGIAELSADSLRYVYIGIVFILSVLFALAARYSTAITHFSPTQANTKQIPIFEWAEILDRVSNGSKWVVIDGHVYDVEQFMHEHPGGSVLLERVLGTDCTDQFGPIIQSQKLEKLLGADMKEIEKSLDPKNTNLKPRRNSIMSKYSRQSSMGISQMHKHSRLAHYRLTSLLVGKLKRETINKANNTLSMELIDETVNTALSPVDFKPVRLIKKDLVVATTSVEKVYKFTFQFEKETDEVEFNAGE